MICAVTEQMHQRIPDLIHHSTIQLCFLTCHVQFHLLIQLLGQLTDHSRELADYAFNGNHPDLHDRLMQVRGYTLQIFNLLIKACTCRSFCAGSRYQ